MSIREAMLKATGDPKLAESGGGRP